MMMASSPTSTSAPIALQAFRVAFVSADSSALDTLDVPSAMEARKNALWVWLLDGGGDIVPLRVPPLKAIAVTVRTSSR